METCFLETQVYYKLLELLLGPIIVLPSLSHVFHYITLKSNKHIVNGTRKNYNETTWKSKRES